MRVHDQDESNRDLAYMISFWSKNQLVWTKKSLKESSWFGEPKCKLESKVAYFFGFWFFFHCFFLPLLLKFGKNGRHTMD
jgi:hypothetical protein